MGTRLVTVARDLLNLGATSVRRSDRAVGLEGKAVALKLVAIDTLPDITAKRVSFIKLDIEGHEGAALRGAERTLRRDMPVVAMEEGVVAETGCIDMPTREARKVRYMGRPMPAYGFIFGILNEVRASCDDVVHHRCNNRRCINPAYLEIGSRGENLQDGRETSRRTAWTLACSDPPVPLVPANCKSRHPSHPLGVCCIKKPPPS